MVVSAVTVVLVVKPAGNETIKGRVVSSHGDYYHLISDGIEGEILARKKKSAFQSPEAMKPNTGDYVRFHYNKQGESMIYEVLPRFSVFERRDPTAKRKSQVLAVNFDYLFIMMSLNENYSEARLERFLELAKDMGRAKAVVVLTKSDLETGRSGTEVPVPGLETGEVEVIRMSNVTGEGLDKIREIARKGVTIALVGSSGVGKSSLVNSLAGEEWCATQEIQEWSGKGRHTTTSRELIVLPNGAMIEDTPGIREIGMVGEVDSELVKGASTHRFRV